MADATEIKKAFWKKLKESPFVMFGLGDGKHSEPLTAQLDDDLVDTLYFFVAKDNRAAPGGPAMVQFVSKGHDFFACLSGTARLTTDRAMIDRLWDKQAEAWFDGGKDDPRLALLRFDIADAEMWEADVSLTGKVKMLFGGKIDADESGSHAKVGTTAENSPA